MVTNPGGFARKDRPNAVIVGNLLDIQTCFSIAFVNYD
jgi:hypothetical protein